MYEYATRMPPYYKPITSVIKAQLVGIQVATLTESYLYGLGAACSAG